MNPRLNASLRYAAVATVTAIVGTVAATPAYAADGDVKVVNTETVQVYTSPTGQIQTRRVYEQLAMTGNGAVDLKNPISTDHLRNLDGFGGFEVKNGEQITRTQVDGEKKLRSVSDYKGKLPLAVSVSYLLDGKNVKPGDIVGEDGKLEVQYTVENVTGTPQEVSFPDGKGGTVTKTVDVPIPMVGSLSTVAPSSFTNVTSQQANIAGDGKGGTKLSFTMTLFPPIGSTTAVFGYTADVKDGVVPRAEISALPVNPLESPTFKTAATSYKGGADTGAELTDGAGQIDANLLKLRDGAGTLLAGLIKLRDGAGELNAGLAGEAVPGSQKLANGAGDLADGLGQINSGAKRLADGTGELSAGAKKLSAGTRKASDGAGLLSDGTKKLRVGANKLSAGATTVDGYMQQIATGQGDLLSGLQLLEAGVQALPQSVRTGLQADVQYNALLVGMQKVVDGIGDPNDVTDPVTREPATLFGAINAIQGGLRDVVSPGLKTILDGIPAKKQGLTCAALILTDVTGGNDAPGACFPPGNVRPPLADETNPYNLAVLSGMATQLSDGATGLGDLSTGLTAIKGAVDQQFVPGLSLVKGGLVNPAANPNCAVGAATASKADDCGVQQAVSFFKASIPVLVDGITGSIRTSLLAGISAPAGGCQPDSQTLICGAGALAQGGSALATGTSDLATGAGDLSDGASLLSEKTGELAAGLGQIDDGAGKLSNGAGQLDDGAGKLSDGAGKASDGSGRLAAGADELASGLGDAANGSGRIADGLTEAAGGAPKLVDGAQRLSDEGTKKLVEAGTGTAQSYGEMYATMTAGAKRAQTEEMAFGAPQDAVGLTAYSYVIKGDDGEGGRNLARGLGGLAVLGAGAGVFALRRRFI